MGFAFTLTSKSTSLPPCNTPRPPSFPHYPSIPGPPAASLLPSAHQPRPPAQKSPSDGVPFSMLHSLPLGSHDHYPSPKPSPTAPSYWGHEGRWQFHAIVCFHVPSLPLLEPASGSAPPCCASLWRWSPPAVCRRPLAERGSGPGEHRERYIHTYTYSTTSFSKYKHSQF